MKTNIHGLDFFDSFIRMARNLRFEAAGVLYHVMAQGDGGREVFEENKDRYDWLDRLGEVCGKCR